MKKKKFLACLMACAMVLSLAACGDNTNNDTPASDEPDVVESTPEESTGGDETPVVEDASIDFEDGNFGFVQVYTGPANAVDAELSVVDFAGSKALEVKFTREGSKTSPYVGIDASSLLGADVAKVASMEVTLGVAYENGTFNAVAGKIYAWSGEGLDETYDEWSVYMANANPKKAVATLAAGEEFVADAGNLFIISLETDNGVADGNGNATLYIDNIRFLDASGNLLTADSSVAFAGPEKFSGGGVDRSNLAALTGAVTFEGFATSAGAWSQDGLDMPQEFIDALVPGSVIEIEYASSSGDIWVLMNQAEAGWIRVGVGNADGSGSDVAYYNNSHNVAQVTFEQLAATYGDDVSTWGPSMQCESSGDWEVFSVKVGQKAPAYSIADAIELEGFQTSGSAWSQNGIEVTPEFMDALVPGSVIEVSYTSTSGDIWVLFNAAEAGWIRVGVGNADGSGSESAVFDGEKCYVPYEMLAAAYGEDKSTWGTSLQCESSGDWEVYSVKVGTATEFQPLKNPVELEGFQTSGGAWSQSGIEVTPEFMDALVPGSVISVSYTSTSGDIWVLFNAAEAGWIRVGVGNADGSGSTPAAYNGSVCQVTYDMLVAAYGEDKSTWGTSLQCESSGDWEVYSVSVGMTE